MDPVNIELWFWGFVEVLYTVGVWFWEWVDFELEGMFLLWSSEVWVDFS